MKGNYRRLGKVRENSYLNKESIKIDSNIRKEICKEFSEWARDIWGTHPEKQKTLDNGAFFEAISNIRLQQHLETHQEFGQNVRWSQPEATIERQTIIKVF